MVYNNFLSSVIIIRVQCSQLASIKVQVTRVRLAHLATLESSRVVSELHTQRERNR